MPTNATPERPAEVEATSVDWFRRMPTGGTRYVATPPLPPTPASVNDVSSYLRQMPTGGATVHVASSSDGGEEGNE